MLGKEKELSYNDKKIGGFSNYHFPSLSHIGNGLTQLNQIIDSLILRKEKKSALKMLAKYNLNKSNMIINSNFVWKGEINNKDA